MQNTAEYDQLARTALHHAAQALRNQENNFVWHSPQIMDEEQIKNRRMLKYVMLCGFAFMLLIVSSVTFLLGIDEFLQKGGWMFLKIMWIMVILFPLLNYWLVLRPMQAEMKRGWRILFFEFDNDLACLKMDTLYAKRKRYLYFKHLNQFPYVFPLPTRPSQQDRALQKYIHEQIEQRTGLPIAEKP